MTRCAEHPMRLLTAVLITAGLAGCASGPKMAEPLADAASGEATPFAEPDAAEGSPEERLATAVSFMLSEQYDAAQDALETLATDFPDSSGPLTNLGILHARAGRNEDAIEAFVRAVQRNPDNVVARNWLGHVQQRSNQPERAERAWLDALRVAPDYVPAHINLGLLYERTLADAQRAIRHYRAAFEASNGEELRVLPWIAELEARVARSAPTEAAVATPASAP